MNVLYEDKSKVSFLDYILHKDLLRNEDDLKHHLQHYLIFNLLLLH